MRLAYTLVFAGLAVIAGAVVALAVGGLSDAAGVGVVAAGWAVVATGLRRGNRVPSDRIAGLRDLIENARDSEGAD